MGHSDVLSCLPLPEIDQDPTPAHQAILLEELPNRPLQVADIARRTAMDPVLSCVQEWVRRGWRMGLVGQDFKSFASCHDDLSAHKGCLLWGSRVMVP